MSLLDSGHREDVTVYVEETYVDGDGNTDTRPSETGFPAKARIQIKGQSGTAARRSEQDNEGFESEKVYELKFPRSFTTILGAQAQIQWRGARWTLFGDVNRYNNSRRTAHNTYTIKRY